MTTYTEEIQTQSLDYVKRSQDAAVQFVSAISQNWAKTVNEVAPADAVPTPSTPELPDPHQLIDDAYTYGAKLWDLQRGFAHELVKASAPAVNATEHAAARAGKNK